MDDPLALITFSSKHVRVILKTVETVETAAGKDLSNQTQNEFC